MVFSSHIFVFVFLPLVLCLHYFSRRQNLVLLSASLLFYFWGEPDWGVLILLLTIGGNFAVALGISKSRSSRAKKSLLTLGILGNVASFVFFKIPNITIYQSLQLNNQAHSTLLLGISFITFHVISYITDVYSGKIQVERSFSKFALYICLFPHLIAGPIIRYWEIRNEIDKPFPRVNVDDLGIGLERFIIGLSKKVLIADVISTTVDALFNIPAEQMTFASAWLGPIFFGVHVYFDFSGYSDMAIGIARMLGFKFPENFNDPHRSLSIREFWQRWHITFATWLKDYVFYPLINSFRTKTHFAVISSTLIAFSICGIWHGITWPTFLWGFYNGVVVCFERYFGPRLMKKWPVGFQRIYFFLVLLTGYTIFRSPNISEIGSHFKAMFLTFNGGPVMPIDKMTLIAAGIGLFFILPWPLKIKESLLRRLEERVALGLRPAILCVLFLVSMAELVNQTHLAFIYFRF